MEKKILTFIILVCFLAPCLFSNPNGGINLEFIGGAGNLSFDQKDTSPLSEAEETFDPQYYPLILARISGGSNGIGFNAGFERGPSIRNRLFANILVDLTYLNFEIGPFFGLLNSRKLPVNPGISVGMGFMIPGIIFTQVKGASTLAFINMDKPDNYSQYSGDAAVGFWVPHVICSMNINYLNFSYRERINLLIEDDLVKYFFRADVFTKNVPYTIKMDLGLQMLSRSYVSLEVEGTDIVKHTKTDVFKSAYIGLEGIYTINPDFKFLLGAQLPVYSWSTRPMKDPPKDKFLFEAKAGVIITLPF